MTEHSGENQPSVKYLGSVPERTHNPEVAAAFASVDERIAAFKATDHDDDVLGARISADLTRLHDEQMTACPGRSIVQAERGWACEGCQWAARIADLTTPYSGRSNS